MKEQPIGVMDSGIGGVTILREIRKLLPKENILYYSDSLHNPYGSKTEEEVYQIVKKVIVYLKEHHCKMIVIACNTATAIAIDRLREEEKEIHFIGTEPAYKMVHDFCADKKTLILATPGTMKSERFQALYHKYDNQQTFLSSCNGLADLIEQDKKEEIVSYLKEHLEEYKQEKVEAVVLGCTHYPLIMNEIAQVLGPVTFFDSSKGVARELQTQLENRNLLSTQKEEGMIKFVDSSGKDEKEKRFLQILNGNLL